MDRERSFALGSNRPIAADNHSGRHWWLLSTVGSGLPNRAAQPHVACNGCKELLKVNPR